MLQPPPNMQAPEPVLGKHALVWMGLEVCAYSSFVQTVKNRQELPSSDEEIGLSGTIRARPLCIASAKDAPCGTFDPL